MVISFLLIFFVFSSLIVAQTNMTGVKEPPEWKLGLPENTGEVTAWLRCGLSRPGITITFLWSDGGRSILRIQVGSFTFRQSLRKEGNQAQEIITLPEAYVEFPELRIRNFIRPNPLCYEGKQQQELIKTWKSLPSAAGYLFPLTLRIKKDTLEYWIDGRYAATVGKRGDLKQLIFKPAGEGEVKEVKFFPEKENDRFMPLEVSRLNRPGVMTRVQISLKPGEKTINKIPFLLGQGENIDVGMAKEVTSARMEIDPYLSRSSFDGMLESILWSLPLNQYIRAWLLCAVEDNPEKEPVVTLRLTRYHPQGRGDAIADTTVWLPENGQKISSKIKQVGTVTYYEGNQARKVPLFLVEVFLKAGEIQDLIFFTPGESYSGGMLPDSRYLDFEILGKLDTVYAQSDRSHKPDKNSTSKVHIFAVTLEKSPVEMEVKPAQVGNIYHGSEKPEVSVHLVSRQPGKYKLAWEIKDIDDKLVYQGKKSLFLSEENRAETIPVPLSTRDNGWYSLKISLLDNDGRLLVEHPSSFAILPEDTRVAGYQSPYGTWWFGSAHLGTSNPQIGGPLLVKAGLRHTTFAWHGQLTEKDMLPWKVTAFQVPWLWRRTSGSLEERAKMYEKAVGEYLSKWPNCQQALIFHESYHGDSLPPELYGASAPEMNAEQTRAVQERIEIATTATRVLREKFPQIKTVFGNCNAGASLAAEFFRVRYPREYIDYLGIEAAGQSFIPEKLTEYGTQAAWVIRETGRKMGYELPVTCCYEWLYRQEKLLGPRRLAEWYIRDALIGLAYQFSTISLALLYDAGNCYYNTLWGAAGLCRRYPLLYPKPVYVAYATLTRILDEVKFLRRIPTGSLTVYALEFLRGKQHIYPLWVPRGNCEVILQFGRETEVTVEDLFGHQQRRKTTAGQLNLSVSTSVQYVISSLPVQKVMCGKRSYPENEKARKLPVINRMEKIEEWELVKEKDERLETPARGHLPLRTAGQYVVREVVDSQMGPCLELELVVSGEIPDITNEYAILRLKNPVVVSGKPRTVGVWVKGNSSWGRVMWEFQDAEGKIFLSSGTGGWGCDILDWPGDISINFEDWCFLQFPVSRESPVKCIVPGGVEGQWVVKNGKSKQIVYPISLTGLALEMPRKTLDLTEMVPVTDLKVRFKNLVAF